MFGIRHLRFCRYIIIYSMFALVKSFKSFNSHYICIRGVTYGLTNRNRQVVVEQIILFTVEKSMCSQRSSSVPDVLVKMFL
jgi:hypothetical protein